MSETATNEKPRRAAWPWTEVLVLTQIWFVVRVLTVRPIPVLDTNDQVSFGLFPHDLLHGLQAPPTAYLPELHQGCTLLWGTMCAPLLAAMGSTFGSLRVCSLLWSALLVASFVGLALHLAGRVGAVTTAALLTFAPPAVVRASASGLPDHIDAAALLAPSLLCALRARQSSGSAAGRWAFGSGLLAGLAVFFLFDAVFVAVAVGATWWWRTEPGQKLYRGALLGVAVGLSPFLTGVGYWRTPGGQEVFARLGRMARFDDSGGPGVLGRAWGVVRDQAPLATGFGEGTPVALGGTLGGTAATWIYLGLLAVLAATALAIGRGERRVATTVAIGGAVLHLAACVGPGLATVNFFYLLPIWPWLVLAAALGVASLVERSVAHRILAVIGLGAAVLLCRPAATHVTIAGTASPELRSFVDAERGHHLLAHRLGYERITEWEPERIRTALTNRPDHRADLARLHGRSVWSGAFAGTDGAGVEQLHDAMAATREGAAELPPSVRALHFLGAGRQAVVTALEHAEGEDAEAVLERVWSVAEGPEAFELGLGLGVVSMLLADLGGMPAGRPEAICTAYGLSTAENSMGTPPFDRRVNLPWCSAPRFAAGYGLGRALRLDPDVPLPAAPDLADLAGRPMSEDAEVAYRCALLHGLDDVRRIVGSDWDTTATPANLGLHCAEGE